MVCIARKTLYSHFYFVCTHTKYMVSGDCTPGVCTARIFQVHTAPGCFHTDQHVNSSTFGMINCASTLCMFSVLSQILLEILTGLPSYDSERNPNDLVHLYVYTYTCSAYCHLYLQISYTELYLSNTESTASAPNIIHIADATAGRWPTKSIHDLCNIARQCLETKQFNRASIEQVRS